MADLQELVIPKIMDRWEDLADALHYDDPTIRSIKQQENNNTRRCCKEFFRDWLRSNRGDGPKQWSTLLKKLNNLELEQGIIDGITTKVKELK